MATYNILQNVVTDVDGKAGEQRLVGVRHPLIPNIATMPISVHARRNPILGSSYPCDCGDLTALLAEAFERAHGKTVTSLQRQLRRGEHAPASATVRGEIRQMEVRSQHAALRLHEIDLVLDERHRDLVLEHAAIPNRFRRRERHLDRRRAFCVLPLAHDHLGILREFRRDA